MSICSCQKDPDTKRKKMKVNNVFKCFVEFQKKNDNLWPFSLKIIVNLLIFYNSYFLRSKIFTPWKLQGLGITGSLQGKLALSMEKGCKNHKETLCILLPHDNYRVSPQSVSITGFIHNILRVSLWFLQHFSIDSIGFPCRDPVIPSPCSFHGVKICSAILPLR